MQNTPTYGNYGHEHPPEGDDIDRNDFVDNVLRQVRRDPSIPIKKAYDSVLSRMGRMVNYVPRFDAIRS